MFTLWPATTVPTHASEPTDPNSVELGVRFTANVNGYVKSIHYGTTSAFPADT